VHPVHLLYGSAQGFAYGSASCCWWSLFLAAWVFLVESLVTLSLPGACYLPTAWSLTLITIAAHHSAAPVDAMYKPPAASVVHNQDSSRQHVETCQLKIACD
jgi:hypothetical protein